MLLNAWLRLFAPEQQSNPLNECDAFVVGHTCDDADQYLEGTDSATMTYKGGYDSGFAAVPLLSFTMLDPSPLHPPSRTQQQPPSSLAGHTNQGRSGARGGGGAGALVQDGAWRLSRLGPVAPCPAPDGMSSLSLPAPPVGCIMGRSPGLWLSPWGLSSTPHTQGAQNPKHSNTKH